jgi:hypothetical protein
MVLLNFYSISNKKPACPTRQPGLFLKTRDFPPHLAAGFSLFPLRSLINYFDIEIASFVPIFGELNQGWPGNQWVKPLVRPKVFPDLSIGYFLNSSLGKSPFAW